MSDYASCAVYVPTVEVSADIRRRFTYHPPRPDQVPRYQLIRAGALGLAEQLLRVCPPGRELSIALSRLEEAVMAANASIAREILSPAAQAGAAAVVEGQP